MKNCVELHECVKPSACFSFAELNSMDWSVAILNIPFLKRKSRRHLERWFCFYANLYR